jgi:methionyl-tRNA formyltransferase
VITSLSHLLPASTISIPPKGTINVHPSLLPRYPGPFPILWQYLENERTFGVTVHLVDAREDAGDVLEQEAFDVLPGTPLETVLDRAAAIGARLTQKAVDDLETGRAAPRAQVGPRGPRARAVRRDEPLVDWERWPIERVWHAMIGTSPWLDALRGATRPPGPWRVGAYEVGDGSGEAGTVGRDARGWYARHPQGKIRLDVSSRGAA